MIVPLCAPRYLRNAPSLGGAQSSRESVGAKLALPNVVRNRQVPVPRYEYSSVNCTTVQLSEFLRADSHITVLRDLE